MLWIFLHTLEVLRKHFLVVLIQENKSQIVHAVALHIYLLVLSKIQIVILEPLLLLYLKHIPRQEAILHHSEIHSVPAA